MREACKPFASAELRELGSLSVDVQDFDYGRFEQAGGLDAFYEAFGEDYVTVIGELNRVLVG